MRETWTFHSAGQLLFGPNASRQLGDVAARLRVRRLLLVTDSNLLRAGLHEPIHVPLSESGVRVEVFSGGEPEPSLRAADACIEVAQDFKPDAILGLGGGSNMDLAKITATGDKTDVFNGVCGAESGGVPVSASSPPLLVSEVEVQKKAQSQETSPILPAPRAVKKS